MKLKILKENSTFKYGYESYNCIVNKIDKINNHFVFNCYCGSDHSNITNIFYKLINLKMLKF